MATTQRRGRLRRSDCSELGLSRVRRGRGFAYRDESGSRLTDRGALERVRALAIPPAWRDVWICPDPLGHLQATGIDAAGRKQYLYHPRWREHSDRQKFRRMEGFALLLPRLRRRTATDLGRGELSRERVLACAVRLLDVGMFRIGSEQYADDDGGLGLATIEKRHVTLGAAGAAFDYPGKGGIRRSQLIIDRSAVGVVRALKLRRGGGEQLLAYRNGRRWSNVRSEEINEYLKLYLGDEFSAKDFRTWNATVMAAVSLATDGRGADTKTARKRAIERSVRAVAELLGNTPRGGTSLVRRPARFRPLPVGLDDRARDRPATPTRSDRRSQSREDRACGVGPDRREQRLPGSRDGSDPASHR